MYYLSKQYVLSMNEWSSLQNFIFKIGILERQLVIASGEKDQVRQLHNCYITCNNAQVIIVVLSEVYVYRVLIVCRNHRFVMTKLVCYRKDNSVGPVQ